MMSGYVGYRRGQAGKVSDWGFMAQGPELPKLAKTKGYKISEADLEEGGGLITEAESSRSSDMLYTNVSPSDAEEELILASVSDSRDCKIIFSNGGRTAIASS
ncbi:hypothetical protein AVEN_57921-1 [Araneus ventricosus]|uniref:Uncharacterized protein n=1 Tax=Araneus ventricosus TaxID=182803 RepID=A0A4Y2KJ51_ARAVE|nr:hypothetical protein AVEN_57921-1 [Araneus ventricosus]